MVLDFRFDLIWEYAPYFLGGTLLTIGISIVAIVLGAICGLLVAIGRMSQRWYLRVPMKAYIHFFRGTPLILQIMIVHFLLVPIFLGSTNAVAAAIAALALNCAAYSAEIYRAGIQSIDKGQMEAAMALGMSHTQAMRHVILPQAVRRMIPAFGNEFIVLIKDSSLVAFIAVPEIMYWANSMRGQYYRMWEPYMTAAVIYLILTYSLSKLLAYVERRLGK